MKKLKTHNLICFWLLFIFVSVTTILCMVTELSLVGKSVKISDLPGVECNFFNDFTNDKSESTLYMVFNPRNIVVPFSAWTRPNKEHPLADFAFCFMISAMFFPIFATKKRRHRANDENYVKLIYFYNCVLPAFTIYFMQFLVYLNCDLFEIIFNKTLGEKFDKNFLIDKIGIDELGLQSKIVIDDLKEIFKAKIDSLIISSTVFGTSIFLLSIYGTTFNLLFAKKIINKSKLGNKFETQIK